jgi:hypothetical protein
LPVPARDETGREDHRAGSGHESSNQTILLE